MSARYFKNDPSVGCSSAQIMRLRFESPSGHEYEIECLVTAEWDPGQRGGWDDPSWPAGFCAPRAYWYRPKRGWKEIELSDFQKEDIVESLDHGAQLDEEYEREVQMEQDRWARESDHWS